MILGIHVQEMWPGSPTWGIYDPAVDCEPVHRRIDSVLRI